MTGQNASLSQYAPPSTTCIECAPPGRRLPETGLDVAMVGSLGALILVAGLCVATILRWW